MKKILALFFLTLLSTQNNCISGMEQPQQQHRVIVRFRRDAQGDLHVINQAQAAPQIQAANAVPAEHIAAAPILTREQQQALEAFQQGLRAVNQEQHNHQNQPQRHGIIKKIILAHDIALCIGISFIVICLATGHTDTLTSIYATTQNAKIDCPAAIAHHQLGRSIAACSTASLAFIPVLLIITNIPRIIWNKYFADR